jgi:hypothetical protein
MLTMGNRFEAPPQWTEHLHCPKCEGPLTRHSFQVREKGQVVSIMNTYHCAQDGDVVPKVKEVTHESQSVY